MKLLSINTHKQTINIHPREYLYTRPLRFTSYEKEPFSAREVNSLPVGWVVEFTEIIQMGAVVLESREVRSIEYSTEFVERSRPRRRAALSLMCVREAAIMSRFARSEKIRTINNGAKIQHWTDVLVFKDRRCPQSD